MENLLERYDDMIKQIELWDKSKNYDIRSASFASISISSQERLSVVENTAMKNFKIDDDIKGTIQVVKSINKAIQKTINDFMDEGYSRKVVEHIIYHRHMKQKKNKMRWEDIDISYCDRRKREISNLLIQKIGYYYFFE